jgi:hypothetical protein
MQHTHLESTLLDSPDGARIDSEFSTLRSIQAMQDKEASSVKESVEILIRRCGHAGESQTAAGDAKVMRQGRKAQTVAN